jgi:hypothetical protein
MPRRILFAAPIALAAACTPVATPPGAPASTATASARAPAPAAPALTPRDVIAAIAADLARLGPSCPRLAAFDPATAVDATGLVISYTFHTHEPRRRGGWTAAVPNPDPDGIYLHIDLHDPASMAQIHTQPVVPMRDVLGMKLMMLLLEGEAGPPCGAAIDAVLTRHGGGAGRMGR